MNNITVQSFKNKSSLKIPNLVVEQKTKKAKNFYEYKIREKIG